MREKLMTYDPTNGNRHPYPSYAKHYMEFHGEVAWLYNPWTGKLRDPRDIGSDVFGWVIIE